jgi:nuclear pore complex protein Nup98-Nup96
MERIPELISSAQENAVVDATVALELEKLRNLIPQLVRALPDVFRDRSDPRHNAALSVMLTGLLQRFDSIKTKSSVSLCLYLSGI